MKAVARKEVLIGALVIVALAILIFGINFPQGHQYLQGHQLLLRHLHQRRGPALSAPVNLNGYKIGLERDMHYDYDRPGQVTVEISVDKSPAFPARGPSSPPDLPGTASISLPAWQRRRRLLHRGRHHKLRRQLRHDGRTLRQSPPGRQRHRAEGRHSPHQPQHPRS